MSIVIGAEVLAVGLFNDDWPDQVKARVIAPREWHVEGHPVVAYAFRAQQVKEVISYCRLLGISPAASYEITALEFHRIDWQGFDELNARPDWLPDAWVPHPGQDLRTLFDAGLKPFWRPHVVG